MKRRATIMKTMIATLLYTLATGSVQADDRYVKVTSKSQIDTGSECIIVYENGGDSKVMGDVSGNYMGYVNAAVINNTIMITASQTPTVFTLANKTTSSGTTYYRLKTGSKYLRLNSTSNTYITLATNTDNQSYWSISFGNSPEYYATIANRASSARAVWWDTVYKNFRAYSGNNTDEGTCHVCLYVKDNDSPEKITTFAAADGMTTHVTQMALDFSSLTNLHAYVANIDNQTVTFRQVCRVPANTPLLIRNTADNAKTENITADVPLLSSETEDVSDNVFVTGTTATANGLASQTTEGGVTYLNYILSKSNEGTVGFFLANNKKVALGKCYLRIEKPAEMRYFIAVDDNVQTQIITLNNENSNSATRIYNLNGQRNANDKQRLPQGIYIINGKKIIVN